MLEVQCERLLLSCVTSNTSGSHAHKPSHCLHHVLQMCGVLQITSPPMISPYFVLAIILVEVDVGVHLSQEYFSRTMLAFFDFYLFIYF